MDIHQCHRAEMQGSTRRPKYLHLRLTFVKCE